MSIVVHVNCSILPWATVACVNWRVQIWSAFSINVPGVGQLRHWSIQGFSHSFKDSWVAPSTKATISLALFVNIVVKLLAFEGVLSVHQYSVDWAGLLYFLLLDCVTGFLSEIKVLWGSTVLQFSASSLRRAARREETVTVTADWHELGSLIEFLAETLDIFTF